MGRLRFCSTYHDDEDVCLAICKSNYGLLLIPMPYPSTECLDKRISWAERVGSDQKRLARSSFYMVVVLYHVLAHGTMSSLSSTVSIWSMTALILSNKLVYIYIYIYMHHITTFIKAPVVLNWASGKCKMTANTQITDTSEQLVLYTCAL